MKDRDWTSMLSRMRNSRPLQTPIEPRDGRPIVFFRTPWEKMDDGWDIAARAYARAMEMGGIDVRVSSWDQFVGTHSSKEGWDDPPVTPDAGSMEEIGHLLRAPKDWDAHIYSSPLLGAKEMHTQFVWLRDNDVGVQAYHCVFERGYIEPQLAEDLNGLDGVWAQCQANRDVLVKHGVKNVSLIYHPYFDTDPHLKIPPPKESKRFYWIGRFELRKRPDLLIRAFMRAFAQSDGCTLTMKMSMYNFEPYAEPEDIIEEEARLNPKWKNWKDSIKIIRGRLSREEMVQLHASNDVYASASRGEGLDLPSFAAKLSGRQLVLTDSGGPRDFMNDGDLLVPTTGQIPADPIYTWGEGATYNDHKLEDLIAALQKVRTSRPTGSRVPPEFRAENVGKAFRSWVEKLC